MPRTYGEVVASSFPEIFKFCPPSEGKAVFMDLGSGYGSLVRMAVEQYGCCYAVGVEKYADKADVSIAMHAGLPAELASKMRFILEDINDTEYTEVLAGRDFSTLVIFCNNLAFNIGTVNRSAVKLRGVMDHFVEQGVKVVIISAQILPVLEDRRHGSVHLDMSWHAEAKAHDTAVYMMPLPSAPAA